MQYQHAIAGLVMAMHTGWSLDIREHEFDDTQELHRALCGSTCLVSLNGLTLNNYIKNGTNLKADQNINVLLQRNR